MDGTERNDENVGRGGVVFTTTHAEKKYSYDEDVGESIGAPLGIFDSGIDAENPKDCENWICDDDLNPEDDPRGLRHHFELSGVADKFLGDPVVFLLPCEVGGKNEKREEDADPGLV